MKADQKEEFMADVWEEKWGCWRAEGCEYRKVQETRSIGQFLEDEEERMLRRGKDEGALRALRESGHCSTLQ